MKGHAATSKAAFRSLPAQTIRDRVLELIEEFGSIGCISDDILRQFPSETKNGSITGRYSELEERGLIYRNGDTRPNSAGKMQMVMRHAKFATHSMLPIPKAKKNPFLEGLKHAAKLMITADPSLKGTPAAIALKTEIIKIARRSL